MGGGAGEARAAKASPPAPGRTLWMARKNASPEAGGLIVVGVERQPGSAGLRVSSSQCPSRVVLPAPAGAEIRIRRWPSSKPRFRRASSRGRTIQLARGRGRCSLVAWMVIMHMPCAIVAETGQFVNYTSLVEGVPTQ